MSDSDDPLRPISSSEAICNDPALLARAEVIPPEPKLPLDRNSWSWLMPSLFLFSLLVFFLYFAPYLIYHWRLLDAQGEAEVVYQKRRAELKADAEHADERLLLLDKRVELASLAFREVARKVSPLVVHVANYREIRGGDPFLLGKKATVQDPDDGKTYFQAGVGSGVVVKPGVILTNHHVVRGGNRLRITFASGQSIAIPAERVLADAITDLAVIRLPTPLPDDLKDEAQVPCQFADSDKEVQVGDWALALGSPLGLRQTLTQGIISAKGRLVPHFDLVELLQTDAAINPGNSGGPLFDTQGRVVGINAAIASDTGVNQGIGFAIPSNAVRKICDRLLRDGEIQRGYLGIALDDVPFETLRKLKQLDGAIVVKDVMPGQSGADAGLLPGDIILQINETPLQRLQSVRHFRALIAELEPNTEIKLHILREFEPQELSVKIGKRPAQLP